MKQIKAYSELSFFGKIIYRIKFRRLIKRKINPDQLFQTISNQLKLENLNRDNSGYVELLLKEFNHE